MSGQTRYLGKDRVWIVAVLRLSSIAGQSDIRVWSRAQQNYDVVYASQLSPWPY